MALKIVGIVATLHLHCIAGIIINKKLYLYAQNESKKKNNNKKKFTFE